MKERTGNGGRGLLFAAAAFGVGPVMAAEVYYQPVISVLAEQDTNLDLDPSTHSHNQGYIVDLATLVGIATPETTTTLRPRVVYRDYPEDRLDDRVDAYLDINTQYRTQRSTASLTGSIQHEDELNAELNTAVYNEVNTSQPVIDTGKVTNGATRDSVFLYPRYVYNFTPLVGGGFSGQYQNVNYTPASVSGYVDFDYYLGRAFLAWTYSQRSDLSVGAIGSYYDAKQFVSTATGSGVSMEFNTNWTPLFSTHATVLFQHTNFDDTLPIPLVTTVNTWGAWATALYKNQTDQFKGYAGRAISPSGGGALYNVDKLQAQYDHNVNARLSFTGALIFLRTHGLTENLVGDDRKYWNVLGEVHWALTRTLFLQGGYQYAFQKYQYDTTAGVNNRVYVELVYRGLGQER